MLTTKKLQKAIWIVTNIGKIKHSVDFLAILPSEVEWLLALYFLRLTKKSARVSKDNALLLQKQHKKSKLGNNGK